MSENQVKKAQAGLGASLNQEVVFIKCLENFSPN